MAKCFHNFLENNFTGLTLHIVKQRVAENSKKWMHVRATHYNIIMSDGEHKSIGIGHSRSQRKAAKIRIALIGFFKMRDARRDNGLNSQQIKYKL